MPGTSNTRDASETRTELAIDFERLWEEVVESLKAEDFRSTEFLLARACEAAASAEDGTIKRHTCGQLAKVLLNVRDAQKTLTVAKMALQQDFKLRNPLWFIADLITYSAGLLIANDEHQIPAAREALQQALDMSVEGRFFGNAAAASTNLALICEQTGQIGQAHDLLSGSMGFLRLEPHKETELNTRVALLRILHRLGRSPAQVLEFAKQTLAIADAEVYDPYRSSIRDVVVAVVEQNEGANQALLIDDELQHLVAEVKHA